MHFFDNEAGGSAHGMEKGGLTDYGRELVQRIQAGNMILDLAHASPQLVDDVLAVATAPVIASHTGLRGVCDSPRNLSDKHVRGIAATGGLVGVAFFPETVCGPTIEDVARSIRYGADLVGVEHVAIGTDFDGAVSTPIDASGFGRLTDALADQGFTEAEIGKIMSGNALRLLGQLLPPDAE